MNREPQPNTDYPAPASRGPDMASGPGRTLNLPGFGPLTRIETDFGLCPAQALRLRDRVRLRSGRFCPLARVNRLLLDESFLERHPEAQPVLVLPNRLGHGMPSEPVLLAPGQKLSGNLRLPPTLGTARDLLNAGIAQRRPERILTYVTFSFAEPEDVCASGLWLRVEPPSAKDLGDDSDDQA
ncbi:MAG TPA: Hint domain-containing protein [Paracoccaceae bacterium]|nr:Hint domain-containing protein [Paracoccaceae bacterium]HMO71781.1 Hint domain-containing protein [Paracoccaceae bacterium]